MPFRWHPLLLKSKFSVSVRKPWLWFHTRIQTQAHMQTYMQSMVNFVWFKMALLPVHSQQGDWRSSFTDSGGLSVTTFLELRRLMLPADNWGSAQHCSLGTTLGMYKYWVLFSRDFITRCFSFGSGSSSQPIWLDSVDCNILDTRIIDCYYEAIVYSIVDTEKIL